MMTLVFASANPNKIAEIRALLPDDVRLLGLNDIGCTEDIPETAATIEGNALMKALYVSSRYGKDCFADDSGLEVDALDGGPGVHSARYAGESKSPEANIDKLLDELDGRTDRRARFVTVIALIYKGEQHLFTGVAEGEITRERAGTNGFGYDPVFRPAGSEKTFAEMTISEKSAISHRAKAVQQLIDFLNQQTQSLI